MPVKGGSASAIGSWPLQLHKFVMLALYVIANIYAAWVFIDAGATTNEFSGLAVDSDEVLVACGLVIFFLCATMLFVHPWVAGLMARDVDVRPVLRSSVVGYIVSGILLGQLIYAVSTGGQVAGQLMYLDSVWAWLFLIFNGDYIFLAYYCFYRDTKWSYVNTVLYVVLGLVRGWGGMFLILGFLELGRQLRTRNYRNIALMSAAIVVIAPVAYVLRSYVRGLGSEMQGQEVLALFSGEAFNAAFDFAGPLNALATMADTILMRLQHLEVGLVVSFYNESLGSFYDDGLIRQYWAEGLIGKLALRAFDLPIPVDLHLLLPGYYHSVREYIDIGYNVHTGFASWLAILGTSFPFIVLYSIVLMVAVAYLVRLRGATREAGDVSWLMTLIFICSGWFGPYEAFLQALIIVVMLEKIFGRIGVRTSPKNLVAV